MGPIFFLSIKDVTTAYAYNIFFDRQWFDMMMVCNVLAQALLALNFCVANVALLIKVNLVLFLYVLLYLLSASKHFVTCSTVR